MGSRWNPMTALERRYWARVGGSPPPESSTEGLPKGLARMLAVAAAVAALLAGMASFSEIRLARDGVETTATVAAHGFEKETLYVYVVYTTAEGRRVRASIPSDRWGDRRPGIGERFRIRYVPSDTAHSASATDRPVLPRFMYPIIFGSAALFFGLVAYSVRSRRPA